MGVLGVWSGGWETVLEEHSGIELLCTVCLCGDTIGHDHLGQIWGGKHASKNLCLNRYLIMLKLQNHHRVTDQR